MQAKAKAVDRAELERLRSEWADPVSAARRWREPASALLGVEAAIVAALADGTISPAKLDAQS